MKIGKCNEFIRLTTYLCRYRLLLLSVALSNLLVLHMQYFARIQHRSNVRRVKGVAFASPISLVDLTMLIALLVYYLVQSAFIGASPVPFIDNTSLAEKRCTDLTHCRTIWSIVWSCLVTIFSCTWVAVHPNIPCPKKRKANSWIERCIWNPLLSFVEHRLPLFICALLVPEYVLAWAIRQFLRAREIANNGEFDTLR